MIDKFIIRVCEHFNMSKECLLLNNSSRMREFINVRQFVWYFIREYTRMSYSEMGAIFNKDHSTALYAVKSLSGLLEFDKQTIESFRILQPIAELTLSNKLKSVSRKFTLDEILMLIELWTDEETKTDFLNFYKDNCDLDLKYKT